MITRGKITLLDNIEIDRSLAKYTEKIKPGPVNFTSGTVDNNTSWISSRPRGDDHIEYLKYLYSNAPTVLLWVKIKLYNLLYSTNFDLPKEKNRIQLSELRSFFESVKAEQTELDAQHVNEVLDKYETVLENAKLNNQIALVEKITDYAGVLKNELILSTSNFKKYLTEESIVKFYNIASKHEKKQTGLKLTYVKNFAKIIPEEITVLKKEADKLCIFDNFVILHYDYDGTAVAETKAEEQRRKDPIMFGVIRGSRNLYYIGDWIDEYCDLTLDGIIKKIGKKSVKEMTPETVIDNLKKI